MNIGNLTPSASSRKAACGLKDEALELIPAPCFFATADADFTVLWANDAFFQLIRFSRPEFQSQYGGRLGALTSDIPHSRREEGMPFLVIQLLHPPGLQEQWLHTRAVLTHLEEKQVYFCVSEDVTAWKKSEQELDISRNMARWVGECAGDELFLYDLETRRAHPITSGPVLSQISWKEKAGVLPFPEEVLQQKILEPSCHADFQDAFVRLQQGLPAVCELQARDSGDHKIWLEFYLKLYQTPSGPYGLGLLRNMTRDRELTLQYLRETQFYQALISEKAAYGQVNVTQNRILHTGGLWDLYNELVDTMTYSQLMETFINRVVHPEDRKAYTELMRQENFIASLKNGVDRLGIQFRRIVKQNQMMWMEISIHLFQEPYTQDVLALLYLQDIDREKRQELDAPLTPAETGNEKIQDASPFDVLLSNEGDMAYLVDTQTYDLLAGNQALFSRLGLTEAQCLGMKCYEAVQKRDTPCPFCSRASWSWEKYYIWRNMNASLEQEFIIKNKLVRWKGREALLALAVDISNNKSIADSLNSDSSEGEFILNGIQSMTAADSLHAAVTSALEVAASFYQADQANFWQAGGEEDSFTLYCSWKRKEQLRSNSRPASFLETVNNWIKSQVWDRCVMVESKEEMLTHSFEMYRLMKETGCDRQFWFPLRDGKELLGVLSIGNPKANLRSQSFLESFSAFIVREWVRRIQLKTLLDANIHDPLTGLYGRCGYERYFQEYDSDNLSSVGVIFSHLNDLKGINERRGHQAGDQFICRTGSLIQASFPEGQVFRMGAGEFLVVISNISHEDFSARVQLLESDAGRDRGCQIFLGSAWDDGEKDLQVQVDQARLAMQVQKKRYADSHYKADTDLERRGMLQKLLSSLNQGYFEVFLQPKVEISTGRLYGAEALIRYHDPEQGYFAPAKFIDILEKNNFIRYIDFFVFERVCALLELWDTEKWEYPSISLNLSRITMLEKNFLSSLQNIYQKYRVPGGKLELEITESTADLGKGTIYHVVHGLRDCGFSIALDDFGTKYSNLSLLADLNFQVLKVDKSLVKSLEAQKRNRVILKNVITMCGDLGISVISEGIETLRQQEILLDLGCQYGQGYLYGKPMTITEFCQRYSPTPLTF